MFVCGVFHETVDPIKKTDLIESFINPTDMFLIFQLIDSIVMNIEF